MPQADTIGRLDRLLEKCQLTERVRRLREAYFEAIPEVCVERARLVTCYHLENGLLDPQKHRITILEKASAYRYVLENRTPIVWHKEARRKSRRPFPVPDESLLAGSTTSKYKGMPLYPELMAATSGL